MTTACSPITPSNPHEKLTILTYLAAISAAAFEEEENA